MMKIRKYAFSLLAMAACCLVGCLSGHDIPAPDIPKTEAKITLRFTPSVMTRSHAGELDPSKEAEVHDLNLYLYDKSDPGVVRHVYIDAPSDRVELRLPHGNYELFAMANAGCDPGEMTLEQVKSYTCHIAGDDDPAVKGLPMSAHRTLEIGSDAEIPILLERAVARVDLSITVDKTCPEGLIIRSVAIRSVPAVLSPFGDNRPALENLLAIFAQKNIENNTVAPCTYYLPENLRGTNPSITDQQYRDMAHAPAGATYAHIYATFYDMKIDYYVFLGSNTTDDFNVRRNRHYLVNVNILGVNNDDLRVSMTTLMLVKGPAAQYVCPQPASMTLTAACTNNPDAALWLSYAMAEGIGSMTLDGTNFPAGEKRRIASDALLEAVYKQTVAGSVRILFTLTDTYDNVLTNEVTMQYRENPLSVTYLTSKVGMVATVAFMIKESGYTGRFTVAYRSVKGSADVSIDGSKIISGGSKTTGYNSASGTKCPVDITPSGDYTGRFTISDSKGNSRIYEVRISAGVKTIDVTEIAQ